MVDYIDAYRRLFKEGISSTLGGGPRPKSAVRKKKKAKKKRQTVKARPTQTQQETVNKKYRQLGGKKKGVRRTLGESRVMLEELDALEKE